MTSSATEAAHFGQYGGRFVPEALVPALDELAAAFDEARTDAAFAAELERLQRTVTGRPSPLTDATRFSEHCGGARILLKREDLNHTGSHKINNVLGQALLTIRMGKRRVIAETGAGQHGVATATAAAMFGLDCVVYMGAEDTRRQALNVVRMQLLGAQVVPVEIGSATLKDAINEAMRDWVTNVADTHYLLGTVTGPHPFPQIVAYFQSIIGCEARQQVLDLIGRLPDAAIACVGGGSNAMGLFCRIPATTMCGWSATRPAGSRCSPAGTRPGSPAAARACCTARGPTSCRTSTVRRDPPTPSAPAWTIPGWDRSTPSSTRAVARSTSRSATTRRWQRSGCCAVPRASSPPSNPRTPSPVRCGWAASSAPMP